MPTYDYECTKCGHRFEAFQSMSDKPLTKCPECGGKVKRLIGAGAGLIFKGSGFYITDYRSDSYKKSAEADKPASEAKSENKSESKSEAKSESKPASTGESKPAKLAADKPKKKPAAQD